MRTHPRYGINCISALREQEEGGGEKRRWPTLVAVEERWQDGRKQACLGEMPVRQVFCGYDIVNVDDADIYIDTDDFKMSRMKRVGLLPGVSTCEY